YDELTAVTWFALSGPAGFPHDVTQRLNVAVGQMLGVPGVRNPPDPGARWKRGMGPGEVTAVVGGRMRRRDAGGGRGGGGEVGGAGVAVPPPPRGGGGWGGGAPRPRENPHPLTPPLSKGEREPTKSVARLVATRQLPPVPPSPPLRPVAGPWPSAPFPI